MIMPRDYSYSKHDLIETPQKYEMSSFMGKEFLLGFFNFRKRIQENIKPQIIISFENVLKLLNETTNSQTTESILSFIIKHMQRNSLSDNQKEIFENLLKKFEITKKIFEKYSDDFTLSSDNERNYRNYLLLSFSCILYYGQTGNLKYLNTCLKLNDTLCSVHSEISNDIDKSLFYHLLEIETNSVMNLIKTKRLTI